MKKLLLAATVAAMGVSAAQAAPTLYGKINLSVDQIENNSFIEDQDKSELNSNASRIGVKGEEKLTDNVSAVYVAEWEISADGDESDAQTFKKRNLFGGLKFSNGPVVDIISGGNIDVNLISRIIERGLIESGRRVRLSMLVPDRPGNLNRILEVIAENKANVVQIYHSMSAQCVGIGQIEVDLILETKDKTQAEGIVEVLEKRGFSVSFK